MSETVTLEKAAADLAALVRRAAAGEEIVIEAAGRPQARLVAVVSAEGDAAAADDRPVLRQGGFLRGMVRIGPDFDAPLPDDVLRYFRGEGD